MKRSKIALAITLSVSALFLTACNDDDDDYIGVNPDKTYISEKLIFTGVLGGYYLTDVYLEFGLSSKGQLAFGLFN